MSAQNIFLVVAACLLAVALGAFFAVGAHRQDPVRERAGKTSTFFERSWEFVFGTKHHYGKYASVEEAFYYSPHPWLLDVLFFVILIFIMIYMNLDLNLQNKFNIDVKGEDLGSILNNLFHPDWQYFFGYGKDAIGAPYEWRTSVVYQIFQTFGIAFIGTLVAAVIALPFGLLASHKLFGRWAWISDIFLILIRTFPEILLGIIIVAAAGGSAMSGVVALGIHGVGMIGKLYAEQFDDINPETLEGLSAAGANSWQKIHLGVMPQARPGLYSVALYRFDINVRTATVLGVVCGDQCGIGFSLSSLNLYTDASRLGSCLIGVLVLVIGIDLFSSWLRKKLV
jgi:phosphonate transport system permease protein